MAGGDQLAMLAAMQGQGAPAPGLEQPPPPEAPPSVVIDIQPSIVDLARQLAEHQIRAATPPPAPQPMLAGSPAASPGARDVRGQSQNLSSPAT